MKLVIAIINRDVHYVVKNLTQEGYSVTKLATTGGFLMSGNATILVGVQDEQVSHVISNIKKMSHSRKMPLPQVITSSSDIITYNTQPPEVLVGGATIFVMDVDRFEKV